MYCILVTGIPAAGKTTIAEHLADVMDLPVISKDRIKEIMYDDMGFQSREEKVKLGLGSMNIMYYLAEQLMKAKLAFILENNFEYVSSEGLSSLLNTYSYQAITVTLTGDYKSIYKRFLERNAGPNRHRGHVVNDCYPEKEQKSSQPELPYESYVSGIVSRGMDRFTANGPQITVDTTDWTKVDKEQLVRQIRTCREKHPACKLTDIALLNETIMEEREKRYMTEKEKSHAGLLYQPGDRELTEDRNVTVKKLYDYNHLYPLDYEARRAAIHGLLGKAGENCVVEQPLFCTYGYNTTLGDNVFLNVNCKLMDSGFITIGNNVFIAPDVSIITEEHAMDVEQRIAGLEYTHPVTIGDNVWICTGAKILPGVTIGENSVIGAGSIVTKDIPANCLAVGSPCKVIRALNQPSSGGDTTVNG